MLIGIEGPAGSGKTTMARAVAPELGAKVLEGGVWYRALTFVAQTANVNLDDENVVLAQAKVLRLDFSQTDVNLDHIWVNGLDATAALYQSSVSDNVARVARHLKVRAELEPRIAQWALNLPSVIFVGRNLKRPFPDSPILRLLIDDTELQRRQAGRGDGTWLAESGRNEHDRALTAQLNLSSEGVYELDVTHLTQVEQAQALRDFIAAHRVE